MKEFTYTITDPLGLHARPAGKLVQTASKLSSAVALTAKGQRVNAKQIIAVMRLCAKQGDPLTFQLEGEEEDRDSLLLEEFCKSSL